MGDLFSRMVPAHVVNYLFLGLTILGSAFAAGMATGKHLSSPGNAAPAPVKKPDPNPPLIARPANPHVGTWVMKWRGSEYPNTKFNANGTYTCGGDLKGAWGIEQNGRQLRVHEYTSGGQFYNWTIDLRDDGLSGVLIEDMSEFKLTPQESVLDSHSPRQPVRMARAD